MAPRPNILWIVTTQWRGQAWGGGGDPNARTPTLDALAAAGLNYRQATTPHPFGPFARAALLTGVPSPENGVRDYFDPLPGTARTVAHAFNERGYVTAFFGKWHLGRRDPHQPLVGEAHARTPVPEAARGGFQFWEGFESGFQLNHPWLQGSRLPVATRLHGYQSDVLCDWVADWIREETPAWLRPSAPPWFAILSLEAPHPPYAAPAAGIAARDASRLILAPNVPSDAGVQARARRELAGYYAHIEATDRAIGRLVATLASDTTVLVTSVHGDMHGSHGLWRKGWPQEESVRIPLVVRGAPGVSPGTVSDAPVSLLDLTAMSLAWSEGRAWHCARAHAPISMPSVVALPDQCDRVWSGWRSASAKHVCHADGSVWFSATRNPGELELRDPDGVG